MKTTANYRFVNWAKNQQAVAQNYFQPHIEEELMQAVKQSNRIRLSGTGHSWSAACLTEHSLINLDNYSSVIHLDKQKLQLKIRAGIKLWQLNELLDKQGLALKNLGSIARQSIAGAVSTGTHGSGINFQILGSQLEEFTLIKADGEKLSIHREREKELFNHAVVNLGCLGVVSDVTLNVVPAFNLNDTTYLLHFDEALAQLDELVQSVDHFKMWWFPHTDKLVLYCYNRTSEPRNDSVFRQWMMDEFLSVNVYRLLLKAGTMKRGWRPAINNLLVKNFIQPLQRIEKSYKVFNVPEPPLHRETEWAFDIKSAKELLRDYRKMIESSNHLINFIQEIRFTKADDFSLSPCYKRDTIWLGAYNADNYGWEELLADFENLARSYDGRPHWGKEFTLDKSYLYKTYEKLDNFNALRLQLDPERKFENEYISQIFS